MRAFQMFMDSFTNSIFNRSSAFGAAGISLVDGIKVSGINLQDNNGSSNDQVTVSLSPDSSTINNNDTSSVIIIALRVPFNTESLMLLEALSSEEQNINLSGRSTGIDPFVGGMMSPFSDRGGATGDLSLIVNPFGFLSEFQIGSTILLNPDWSIPQLVTMDLVGGEMIDSDINNNTQSRLFPHNLDLVFVEVIPFTGKENPA